MILDSDIVISNLAMSVRTRSTTFVLTRPSYRASALRHTQPSPQPSRYTHQQRSRKSTHPSHIFISVLPSDLDVSPIPPPIQVCVPGCPVKAIVEWRVEGGLSLVRFRTPQDDHRCTPTDHQTPRRRRRRCRSPSSVDRGDRRGLGR